MTKNIIIVLSAVVLCAGAYFLYTRYARPAETSHEAAQAVAKSDEFYYTCPMHPSVRSDKPGACPVCGMTLVKKTLTHEPRDEETSGIPSVHLSQSQRVVANVATQFVMKKRLRKEITAAGKIDYAEPSFRHISMRFPGRIEKIYLSYTGQHVGKGDPVAELYSPEAISAQQEYLLAKESYEQVSASPDLISNGAHELYVQSRQKLLLWGFTEGQIIRLDSTGSTSEKVTIYSPVSGIVLKKNIEPQKYVNAGDDLYDVADLSTVWMYADVYEKDLQFLATGESIRMWADAYPGEVFSGKVSFVDPVVDPQTRTARVRAEFPNPGLRLRPGMFVKAEIEIPVLQSLAVPKTAILSTGRRDIVWIEVANNTFEPREITVGTSTESYTQVLSGLEEGESVVITGGYLLESESQLQHPATAATPHDSGGSHD